MSKEASAPAAARAGNSLFERCRAGDLTAYEELFQQQGARMKSIAYHLLGSRADAEDAVQEAFLKIYRGVSGFREQARFTTWIYRVLLNTCHDMGRQKQRRQEFQPLTDMPQSGSPTLRHAMDHALTLLSERQRMVFLLAEVEGFDHAETAALMETTEGNSRYLLWQAKSKLREVLSGVSADE